MQGEIGPTPRKRDGGEGEREVDDGSAAAAGTEGAPGEGKRGSRGWLSKSHWYDG